MPKYSFIVPVYNVEKYVEECLNSLLCQEFDDFEIIVVDDGATDSSYLKCEALSYKDSRITIIRQSNQGLGEARNTGLRNAKGQYVIFVDSDDFWISSDCLKKIDEQINKYGCDVLCYKLSLFNEEDKLFYGQQNKLKEKVNNYDDYTKTKKLIINDVFSVSACGKVILRSLILGNGIYFNKGLSEDIDWCARILLCANKVNFINKRIYAYRQNRAGSITNTVLKIENLKNYINIIDTIKCYIEEFNIENDASKSDYINYYCAGVYRNIIINYLKGKYKDDFIREKILKYKYLIKYLTGFKMLVFKVANFFNLNFFMKILGK